MKFALALLSAIVSADLEHTELEDGSTVVQEYEIVTVTTTTEHIDIAVDPPECETNCVYNDFVLVYDSVLITEWAYALKAEYDLLLSDW